MNGAGVLTGRRRPVRFPTQSASALATTAAAMAPGTWAEVTGSNMVDVICQGAADHNRLPYANSVAWNPFYRKIHVIGSDHQDVGDDQSPFYMSYDVDTNTWTDHLQTGVFNNTHVYSLTAANPSTGIIYHKVRPDYPQYDVWRAPGNTGNADWEEFTTWPTAGDQWIVIALGTTWWRGALDGVSGQGAWIIWNCGATKGEILGYDPVTDTWPIRILDFAAEPWPGAQDARHNGIAGYSGVHNCLVGGGGGWWQKRLWRTDSDLTTTELTPFPGTFYPGIQSGNFCEEPVSGNFLVISDDHMWEFDPTGSGTWAELPDPPSYVNSKPNYPSPESLASCSIPEHGVVMYLSANGSQARMDLYKHA